MVDIIERIGKSTIQHGSYNQRIYLMHLSRDDFPEIIVDLDKLAKKKSYSKIFAKVPGWAKKEFLKTHYVQEAVIPHFFNDTVDGVFLGKFINSNRGIQSSEEKQTIRQVLHTFRKKKTAILEDDSDESVEIKQLSKNDIVPLTNLYKEVFESYPFPIFSPWFIEQTMQDNVAYYGMYHDKDLIAASSAEMDTAHGCVEMTDFATLPSFRGKNLSFYLLQQMEQDMKELKLKTAYTIARAESFGMNVTFGKAGYGYAGTLVHNTNIAGRIESMNVLYKKLDQ